MKKLFQIPILQCCKPFHYKETQTESSFLARKKHRKSLSEDSSKKETESISLEFDTNIINNSSHSFVRTNRSINLDNDFYRGKGLTINLDESPKKTENQISSRGKRSMKNESQEDISYIVEVSNTLIPQSVGFTDTLFQSREHTEFVLLQCLIVFEFVDCLIAGSVHSTDTMDVLCLTQSIYRKIVVTQRSITVHPILSYLSLRYVCSTLEETSLTNMDHREPSKANCELKRACVHYSMKSQTKSKKPPPTRLREEYQYEGSNVIKPLGIGRRKPGNNENIRKKYPKLVVPNLVKQSPKDTCSVIEYKDFLSKWKMRKIKQKSDANEKLEFNTFATSSKSKGSAANHVPSKSYMIRFINDQYRNGPLTFYNNNLSTNFVSKSTQRKTHNRNKLVSRKCSQHISATSLDKMSRQSVCDIYDKVVNKIAGKVWILLNIFDKRLLEVNSTRLTSKLSDCGSGIQTQSFVLKEEECIMDDNKSHCSTSNSRDYTASTAFDIASDQAYSEDGSSPLSI